MYVHVCIVGTYICVYRICPNKNRAQIEAGCGLSISLSSLMVLSFSKVHNGLSAAIFLLLFPVLEK